MATEISDIVSDLMKVGAMIPEPKLAKCLDAHESLLDGISEAKTLSHAFMSSPTDTMKDWDTARVEAQRVLVNNLSRQGYIPQKDAEIMQSNLNEALYAIKASEWITAVQWLQRYSSQIEISLPVWHQDCASVKKGEILTGVYHGVNILSTTTDLPTQKNFLWKDIIAALNIQGILTSEEADKLVKEVRW